MGSRTRPPECSRAVAVPALAGLILSACASVTPIPTDVASSGMANSEVALRQSMHTVEAQMTQLGGLVPRPRDNLAAAPVDRTSPQGVLPEPLQRTISFAWDGPLDAGVARLAASVGYTFIVTAAPGTVPPLVSIAVRDVPAWQVFRALGEAAGTTATVRLVPVHAQVQVIYHG